MLRGQKRPHSAIVRLKGNQTVQDALQDSFAIHPPNLFNRRQVYTLKKRSVKFHFPFQSLKCEAYPHK